MPDGAHDHPQYGARLDGLERALGDGLAALATAQAAKNAEFAARLADLEGTPPVVVDPPPVDPPVTTPGVTNASPFTGRWKAKTPASLPVDDAKTKAFRGYQATTWINADSYSVPVYVATMADPLVKITPAWGRPAVEARVPSSAVPAAGTDSNMAIIQPDGTTVDVWTAKWVDSKNIHAGRVNKTSLSGSGFGPQAGIRGSGANSLGGLIRSEDVKAGVIAHALAMAVPTPMLRYTSTRTSDGPDGNYMLDGTGTSMGYVSPATEQDYDAQWVYKGVIPMGSRVVLPRSVSLDSLGLSPSARMVALALQDFGGYILDTTGTGGSVSFYAEPSLAGSAWHSEVLGPNWTAQSLAKIRQNLVIVAP